FAAAIADMRLSLEVSVINTLAHRLTRILRRRDPLSEKVHLGLAGVAGGTTFGILHGASQRIGRRLFAGAPNPRGASGQGSTQAAERAAERASRSSFYTGMRILPREQREAMFEIYAFCRAVDDIADDPGPREGRLAALETWRSDIAALYAGAAPARSAG